MQPCRWWNEPRSGRLRWFVNVPTDGGSRFFQWLSLQPGFKSRLTYSNAEYFNTSAKDERIAKATREKPVPSLEQIRHVLSSMPAGSDIERRARALIAFAILSGARDDAIASMSLKNVDLERRRISQSPREGVRTKNGKSITSTFFPVGTDIEAIVSEWIGYLRSIGFGDRVTRYFLPPESNSERAGTSKTRVWPISIGRMRRPSAEFSRMPSSAPACRTSTLTASEIRLRRLGSGYAQHQRPSRPGVKIWATLMCSPRSPAVAPSRNIGRTKS